MSKQMQSVVELIEDTPYMFNLKENHYYSVLRGFLITDRLLFNINITTAVF